MAEDIAREQSEYALATAVFRMEVGSDTGWELFIQGRGNGENDSLA